MQLMLLISCNGRNLTWVRIHQVPEPISYGSNKDIFEGMGNQIQMVLFLLVPGVGKFNFVGTFYF